MLETPAVGKLSGELRMSFTLGERAIPSSLTYAEVRPLLRWVYAWMFLGLMVTAAVAFLANTNEALIQLRSNPGVVFGSVFAQLALVVGIRSEEHTSELQSRENLVCRLLLEKKTK